MENKMPTYQELEQRIKGLELENSKLKAKAKENEVGYGDLFENLVDEVHIWKLIKDRKGNIKTWKLIDANPSALNSWGKIKEKVIGKTAGEIFKYEAEKAFMPIIEKIFNTGKPHSWETFFPPTNQYLSMRSIPFNDYFISTGRDISEHKKIENERTAYQNEFQTWIQNTPICTKKVDLDFNLQFMSQAGIKELKVDDVHKLYGAPYPFYFFPKEFQKTMTAKLEKVKESGEIIQIDGILSDTKGNRMWYNHILVPVKINNGKLDYILIISTDISKRKQAEQELIKEKENSKIQNTKINHLYQAAKAVLDMDDFITTAKKLFDSCKTLTGATSGYVALLTDDGEENEVKLLDSGGLPCSVDERLPMPIRGLRAEAYHNLKAVYHNDFMNSKHIKYMPQGHVILNNVMFAPLIINKKAVGLIGMANKPTDFNNDDLETVTPFAELASIALKNSRAFEELVRTKNKAEGINERLDYATSVGKVGMWDWNIIDHSLIWNAETYRILGHEPFSITPSYELFLEIVHPDDRKFLDDNVKAAWNEKKPYSVDCRIILNNNEIRFCNATGKVEYDNNSKPIRMIGTFQDITDRKNIENELRLAKEKAKEGETFLQSILENIPNMIFVKDAVDLRFTHLNRAGEELLGYKRHNIIGKCDYDFFPKKQAKYFIEKDRSVLNSNKSLLIEEEAINTKSGKRILSTLKLAIKDKQGKNKYLLGISVDITNYKNTETELLKAKEKAEESEQRLKLASQSAALGIWDWNVKENTMTWDERMFELYGATKKTFTKTVDAWMNGLHPDDKDRAIAECNDALKGIKNFDTTFRVQHPDGKVLYIKGDGLVLRDPIGNAIRMIGINRDVTASKQNEIELKIAKEKAEESDRLKTEFLNNMSHEIRTPMNGIIGFSEMLDKPNISDEKRKYYSKIVQNSSQQLLKIINDILDISTLETKQEKINEEEFCLNDLLTELFSVFNLKSKERNIPIYVKKAMHDDQCHIATDKAKLIKIVSNLLENAIKYTNEGFIELGYYIENKKLVIYLKDTGIGIAPENHKFIFERFSREVNDGASDFGGLGLGLSISKENAQLLGGDITLESEKDKGSTFYVAIPFKHALTEKNNRTTNDISHLIKTDDKYTILIVEDEEVNYLYIEVLFEEETEGNYNLIHAKNGKEAVEICTESKNIDLVLMDIKMPVMNGHEATEKIKEKFPNIPVIAQTAYSTESDKQLALQHGCDDFISKPINKEKLHELVNKYLIVK